MKNETFGKPIPYKIRRDRLISTFIKKVSTKRSLHLIMDELVQESKEFESLVSGDREIIIDFAFQRIKTALKIE